MPVRSKTKSQAICVVVPGALHYALGGNRREGLFRGNQKRGNTIEL